MSGRFTTLACGALIGGVLTGGTLLSCQQLNHDPAATQRNHGTSTQPADIAPQDLRDTLADLANAHNDKIKLSMWVATPFLRPVDAPFQPFFENMGKKNKELIAELKAWAKSHNVDLTYHLSNDLPGRAQKIMEDRQEKLVRGDNKTDFQHDILMQMYNDYEWNLSQIQALLPAVKDPALKAYLEKSEKMYTDGSAEIMALLRRYKFQ